MNLEDLLKYNEVARLSVGDKWLVWADDLTGWVVYQHQYGAHSTKRLYSGHDLDKVINTLAEYS